jgi:hypothetical protein
MMGERRTGENYQPTKQQIEQWIIEARQMWVGAYRSILRVRRLQDKLIQQNPR